MTTTQFLIPGILGVNSINLARLFTPTPVHHCLACGVATDGQEHCEPCEQRAQQWDASELAEVGISTPMANLNEEAA